MRGLEQGPRPMKGLREQLANLDSVSPNRFYTFTINDVKERTGLTSSQMVRRYVRRLIINNPDMESEYLVVNSGKGLKKGPKILLTEYALNEAVDGIISIRGIPIEQPTAFPDGSAVPYIKSRRRRELINALLKAREEERLFHMQEFLGPDLHNIPLIVDYLSFRYHINTLNKEIKETGWKAQSDYLDHHRKELKGRKYSYFLRREGESSEKQSTLLTKMQIKEQILSTAVLLVLSHLAGQKIENFNKSIYILLETALKKNFPDSKGLTQVFVDTSENRLKHFFLYGLIYTIQTLSDTKDIKRLSEEERQINDYYSLLGEAGDDLASIMRFVKREFDIKPSDKPQRMVA